MSDFDIKEKLWLFPLLGGVISLLALLAPALTYIECYNVWMYGLHAYVWKGSVVLTDPDTYFFESDLLTISITCTLSVAICSAIIIIMSVISSRDKMKSIARITWLVSSIIMIVAPIIWRNALISSDHWIQFYDLAFGFIGIYIGAVLALIGSFVKS